MLLKVGGHQSLGHLTHRKFRGKKGTLRIFGLKSGGGARGPPPSSSASAQELVLGTDAELDK